MISLLTGILGGFFCGAVIGYALFFVLPAPLYAIIGGISAFIAAAAIILVGIVPESDAEYDNLEGKSNGK